MFSHPFRLLLPAFAALLVAACGSTANGRTTAEPVSPMEVSGVVSFATRQPTPAGASERLGRLVAPQVGVRAIDADGATIAETRTNDEGRFSLETDSRAVELEVVAHTIHDGHDLAVTTDARGEVDHTARLPITGGEQEVHFGDDVPMAGALHILEAMLRGSRAVREWTGRRLPPFFCYWSRGVTTNWSFYSGERADTGRYTIELLGGEPGAQASTDTDEHDEGIILHEFGHFVMDQLSSSSSHGGSHPRGALIDPGLAWEEGRATWFATVVLGTGWYQDTIGLEPNGELRVHHDVERGIPMDIRGLGSEAGVAEILWDLADGGEALRDQDQDGVALGPDGVLAAMVAMAEEPGAFPTIGSFLRFLIRSGRVEEAQLRHILLIGRHPVSLIEEDDHWPRALALGTPVTGKVDGLSNPAPSGGPNRPSNGIDAVQVYRFHLESAARVVLTLTIDGTGRGAEHQDLDLELRDIRSDLIQQSNGETPTENIAAQLEPGHYIVYVRDGGQGNKVSYRLETAISR